MKLNLKELNFCDHFFPLDFNDNIYHEGNISKMPDSDVFFFLFWNANNVKAGLMLNVKWQH